MAAIGVGMAINTVRWLLLDAIHYRTGVPRANWDARQVTSQIAGFETLVEYHFRYYQFYGNTLLALLLAVSTTNVVSQIIPNPLLRHGAVVTLAVVFFLASRDALIKYHTRTNQLLEHVTTKHE